MKNSTIQGWNKVKQKGLLVHLLQTGLSWGLFMFVVSGLINQTFEYGFWHQQVLVSGIIWILSGFVYAAALWFILKRAANKVCVSDDTLD